MLRLDIRLQAILDRVPCSAVAVDIGTDHGKLAVALVLNNVVKRVIATDISRLSLDKAIKLAEKYSVSDKIDCRLGDGLNVIKENEAETLVIAGMGAGEIISILSGSRAAFNTYVFSPHRDTVKLRQYLSERFLIIRDDKIKYLNKFYDIIVCIKGSRTLSYKELMLGMSDNRNEAYKEFVLKELEKADRMLGIIPRTDIRYQEYLRYKSLLNEVLNDEG